MRQSYAFIDSAQSDANIYRIAAPCDNQDIHEEVEGDAAQRPSTNVLSEEEADALRSFVFATRYERTRYLS